MKIIVQRVNFAEIFVNNKFKGKIQKGIVAYIGITNGDSVKDIDFCIDKLINLRIFDDESGKLNVKKLEQTGIRFETGEFGQYMRIVSENDGPVNLIIDSK